MLFQYIGDDNEPPVKTKVYGIAFELDGEPVEVTDPKVASKLKGNKCFIEIDLEREIDEAFLAEELVTDLSPKKGKKAK